MRKLGTFHSYPDIFENGDFFFFLAFRPSTRLRRFRASIAQVLKTFPRLEFLKSPDSRLRRFSNTLKGYWELLHSCSNTVLCTIFPWWKVKTCLIRLRLIEGTNASDQIAFGALHLFLVEVQTKLVTYGTCMRNNNPAIRTGGSRGSSCPRNYACSVRAAIMLPSS